MDTKPRVAAESLKRTNHVFSAYTGNQTQDHNFCLRIIYPYSNLKIVLVLWLSLRQAVMEWRISVLAIQSRDGEVRRTSSSSKDVMSSSFPAA